MSSGRVGWRSARALIGALALGLALVFGVAPAIAAEAHTSPEDRARFISITHKLEAAPFQPGARDDRAWAFEWLTDAPDVSVNICANAYGGLDKTYPYDGEVLFAYMFAMAAIAIENPDVAKDESAKQLAGVVGVLKTYRSILSDKPDGRSAVLDSLLAVQARGGLPDFIRKAWASCSAKR